jgi:hypothetical protein
MTPQFSAEMVHLRLHPMSLAQDLGVIELLFSQNMAYIGIYCQMVMIGNEFIR